MNLLRESRFSARPNRGKFLLFLLTASIFAVVILGLSVATFKMLTGASYEERSKNDSRATAHALMSVEAVIEAILRDDNTLSPMGNVPMRMCGVTLNGSPGYSYSFTQDDSNGEALSSWSVEQNAGQSIDLSPWRKVAGLDGMATSFADDDGMFAQVEYQLGGGENATFRLLIHQNNSDGAYALPNEVTIDKTRDLMPDETYVLASVTSGQGIGSVTLVREIYLRRQAYSADASFAENLSFRGSDQPGKSLSISTAENTTGVSATNMMTVENISSGNANRPLRLSAQQFIIGGDNISNQDQMEGKLPDNIEPVFAQDSTPDISSADLSTGNTPINIQPGIYGVKEESSGALELRLLWSSNARIPDSKEELSNRFNNGSEKITNPSMQVRKDGNGNPLLELTGDINVDGNVAFVFLGEKQLTLSLGGETESASLTAHSIYQHGNLQGNGNLIANKEDIYFVGNSITKPIQGPGLGLYAEESIWIDTPTVAKGQYLGPIRQSGKGYNPPPVLELGVTSSNNNEEYVNDVNIATNGDSNSNVAVTGLGKFLDELVTEISTGGPTTTGALNSSMGGQDVTSVFNDNPGAAATGVSQSVFMTEFTGDSDNFSGYSPNNVTLSDLLNGGPWDGNLSGFLNQAGLNTSISLTEDANWHLAAQYQLAVEGVQGPYSEDAIADKGWQMYQAMLSLAQDQGGSINDLSASQLSGALSSSNGLASGDLKDFDLLVRANLLAKEGIFTSADRGLDFRGLVASKHDADFSSLQEGGSAHFEGLNIGNLFQSGQLRYIPSHSSAVYGGLSGL